MYADLFDAAIHAIAAGPLNKPITRLVEVAARIANTSGAMLTCRKNDSDYIFASRGLPFNLDPNLPVMPGTARLFEDGPVVIPDVKRDAMLQEHPFTEEPAAWRFVVVVPVHVTGAPRLVALTCGSRDPSLSRPANLAEQLRSIAAIVADEIDMIGEILLHAGNGAVREPGPLLVRDVDPSAYAAGSPDGDVTADFLLSTTIAQRRLLRRGDVNYHAVRRWRAPIKRWQLEALKSFKRNRSEGLTDRVARELAQTARRLYGDGVVRAVAAVPCGHSGPTCLAHRLAVRTAEILQVTHVEAFEPMTVSGTSHPRKNIGRPKMALRAPLATATLLIDDVASSGAHIEEATTLLRQVVPAVFPLVWIAD